ncbi:MAG: N-acyl-D-amino-acid deacylase family protein [Rhodospirillaceae bacterium]
MTRPTNTLLAGASIAAMASMAMTTAFVSQARAANAPADFIIAGGTVYTGADASPTVTNVVIVGDKIAYIGPDAAKKYDAKKTVNAKGKIVSPGFIDGHAHADDNLNSPDAKTRANDPWLYQGATTLLIGVDGGGTPDISDEAAKFGKDGIGSNVVPYVGFGNIRSRILKNDAREPTAAELAQEKALVVRGMCQGAVGISTGLFYAPQFYAKTEEVIELAKEAAKRGGNYDTHQRDESSYTTGLMASVAEVIRIGREAHIPVHFTHIKALGVDVQGKAPEVIAAINAARAQGIDVTANQYPWSASGTGVQPSLIPRWAEDGGRAALLKRFEDPTTLEKIRTEMRDNLRRRGGPESMLLISSNQEWTGLTLGQIAAKWKMEPIDAGIKIIKTGQDGGSVASFNMAESDIAAFMKQPWMVTSSDGGGNHPRTVASFSRKYEKYVKQDKIISEAEFIRSSTGRAADIYRLENRGYLRVGYFADVTVFDPNNFKQKADYVKAKELTEGVEAVFINGKAALMDGKGTGELAGRVILHKPPAGTCS